VDNIELDKRPDGVPIVFIYKEGREAYQRDLAAYRAGYLAAYRILTEPPKPPPETNVDYTALMPPLSPP
jgi:hypothetical protein